MYYYVPRPEDLAGLYAQLAHTFDECGPHAWPTPSPCVAEINHADIVLVLDMSTSMYRTTSAGRSKQAAAIEAAKVFVQALELEVDGWGRQDQAAIVGFNGSAWVQVGLTGDRARLAAGLDALPGRSAEGTRLDLAFQWGQQALEDPARLPENRAVMIVLTDGLPNKVPFEPGGSQEATVRAAAAAAKAKGTRIYTVGLGAPEDIDEALLADCASQAGMFYFAPDGEDLERIYREIAGRITSCQPE
jgi:Mg-chelatase subunit ChlD